MRELKISANEAGLKLDKYLMKFLNEAPASFTYKMLRKKNITLNGKKATGSEKLVAGDIIKLFLSDETIDKFSKVKKVSPSKKIDGVKALEGCIIYEDENVLFINKKVGMLSQKSNPDDVSLNEYMIDYLIKTNALNSDDLRLVKPSVCNRLDRNTTGLITCGKSIAGLQELSRMFKERCLDKYYIAIVYGVIEEGKKIYGYLKKNEEKNMVIIENHNTDKEFNEEEYDKIETYYEPLYSSQIKESGGKTYPYTVLKVKLITGKTHQIRAHLSSINHPIIGDIKYGNKSVNDFFKNNMGIKYQLLHSYELQFNDISGPLDYLNNKKFNAKLPQVYNRFYKTDII